MSKSRSPFGPHITDYRDWDAVDAYIEATEPRASLVLGDAPLIRHLCDKFPNMTVVARRWGKEDDNIHRRASGELWVDVLLAWLGGDTRPLLYWDNEPTFTGVADTPEAHEADEDLLIFETLRAYDRASALGVRVIGPNWGAFWPQNPAKFADIFHAAVQQGHMIGMHYYVGLSWTRDYGPNSWMMNVTDAITQIEPRIEIGGTEFGLDSFPDLVKSGALPKTGPPWAITDEEGFGLEHIAANERYFEARPNIRWGVTFTWGSWFGPDYDISQKKTFQAVMASQTVKWPALKPIPAEDEPVDPNWQKCTLEIVATNGVNVRASASTSAARLGGIAAGNYPALVTEETVINQGYTWQHIQAEMLDGWIAIRKDAPYEQYANITIVAEPPPPPPAEDCKDEQAEIARLQAENEAQQDLLAKYQKYMGQMEQIREEFYSRLRRVGDDLDGEINGL